MVNKKSKNTGLRGDAAVLLASSKLLESGLIVLKPISDCLPFDIVIYNSKSFNRIQIKRAFKAKSKDKYLLSLKKSL